MPALGASQVHRHSKYIPFWYANVLYFLCQIPASLANNNLRPFTSNCVFHYSVFGLSRPRNRTKDTPTLLIITISKHTTRPPILERVLAIKEKVICSDTKNTLISVKILRLMLYIQSTQDITLLRL
jgi:hypothetical protein